MASKTNDPNSKVLPIGGKKPPNAGKGRVKGVPNKITADVKAMVLQALTEAGGVKYLVSQAKKSNPAPFMALVGKVLPLTVAGDPSAPLLGMSEEALNAKLNELMKRVNPDG